MADRFDLSRFVQAQAGIYPAALAELREGAKRTHWMWFIFPQVLGLGLSANARLYAINGLAEARAYLDHSLLGPRLIEATEAMLVHAGTRTPLAILGPIDALKFRSSMTLFEVASVADHPFTPALERLCDGQRDAATIERLAE
ncbi:DUF1810 family protein [Erythrobacter arachoides]|uniref:DUF1810 family protein n=1 Tax=Aurantiacibacter arachoides TaxID=1850444 RepID=A0A845A1G2_9SPHN|nr:DUF1810 domain-containing protein [Aurantiacibacter arachoides]MXO93975.1 DUF1810 family protein [Aurantiacibacter arachoides]GGD45109.1 hypothetical protein GCM10011411_00920 [Aurantiacibacter arachoides]